MNTLRRLLFTILVVTLLVGALAMPTSVAAAGPTGRTRVVSVTPEAEISLNVGPVLVRIPAEATAGLDPFELKITVWQEGNRYAVELEPDGCEFKDSVLISFGPRVSSATEGDDASKPPLEEAEREYWRGNQPAYWVNHFSRYSGWF